MAFGWSGLERLASTPLAAADADAAGSSAAAARLALPPAAACNAGLGAPQAAGAAAGMREVYGEPHARPSLDDCYGRTIYVGDWLTWRREEWPAGRTATQGPFPARQVPALLPSGAATPLLHPSLPPFRCS